MLNKNRILMTVAAVITVSLFFMGCSDDYGSGKSGGGELPNLTNAGISDGKLDAHDGNNDFVTEDNLENAKKEIFPGLYGYSNGLSAVRNIRKVYTETYENNDTIYGLYEGYCTMYDKGDYKYDDVKDCESENGTLKAVYYNFSNYGKIFLGGGIGVAESYENYDDRGTHELKINGEVEFNGQYRGSVMYKNFYYIKIYKSNKSPEYSFSGDIVIKSGGREFSIADDFKKMLVGVPDTPDIPDIPNPNLDQKVVGNWLIYEEDDFMEFYIFNSDGSGSLYEYSERFGYDEYEFSWYSENGFLYLTFFYEWWSDESWEYFVSGSTLTITRRYGSYTESYTCSKYSGALPRGLRNVRERLL
jgi:hypothetical protein